MGEAAERDKSSQQSVRYQYKDTERVQALTAPTSDRVPSFDGCLNLEGVKVILRVSPRMMRSSNSGSSLDLRASSVPLTAVEGDSLIGEATLLSLSRYCRGVDR